MSNFRLPKTRLPALRRRSFLAAIASVAATLTVTRRVYGAEIADADKDARGGMHPPGEGSTRSFGDQTTMTIDLKAVGPENQVASINNSGETYRVTTVSGRTVSFSEFDLRFKTDASAHGPSDGQPVLISVGMRADRAFIVFASFREISTFIDQGS